MYSRLVPTRTLPEMVMVASPVPVYILPMSVVASSPRVEKTMSLPSLMVSFHQPREAISPPPKMEP